MSIVVQCSHLISDIDIFPSYSRRRTWGMRCQSGKIGPEAFAKELLVFVRVTARPYLSPMPRTSIRRRFLQSNSREAQITVFRHPVSQVPRHRSRKSLSNVFVFYAVLSRLSVVDMCFPVVLDPSSSSPESWFQESWQRKTLSGDLHLCKNRRNITMLDVLAILNGTPRFVMSISHIFSNACGLRGPRLKT